MFTNPNQQLEYERIETDKGKVFMVGEAPPHIQNHGHVKKITCERSIDGQGRTWTVFFDDGAQNNVTGVIEALVAPARPPR